MCTTWKLSCPIMGFRWCLEWIAGDRKEHMYAEIIMLPSTCHGSFCMEDPPFLILYLPVLEMCWDRHSISGRPNSQPNPLWLGSMGGNLHSLFFFWPFCGCISAWKYLICWFHLAASISPKNINKKPLQSTANPTSSSLKFQPSNAWVKGGLEVVDPIKPQVASRVPVGGGREAEKCTGKGFLDLLAHRRLCYLT